MVYGVTNEVTRLGCSMIAEEWESYDELLRKRKDLRRGWYIVRRDETSLLTSLGEVIYHKTLFKNVATSESCYLLDQLMGLEHHARITEDAEARILQEASESSYRKGGASASINGESISKEAVMNKLHRLEFPVLKAAEKKELRTLYIDADEDHVALQYLEKKGDIRKPRINTVMPWIIYVYEGVEGDEEGRPRLINPKYFGGVYDGQEAASRLWAEVLDYLDEAYDLDAVDRIYINGDGAAWIRTGEKIIPKSKFALDKYHIHKYIIAATSHLEDTAEDARSEIYRAIHKKKKWMAEGVFDRIIGITDKETKRKAVEQAKAYILGNWSGIMISMKSGNSNVRCSAEGHVKHDILNTFSSGQLSGFVLAFLFSMNKQYVKESEDDLGFILIDDPVQTMDDINISSMIEVLRNDFKDRQIILSTHETDKENYILYKFFKYNRIGQSFNAKDQLYGV